MEPPAERTTEAPLVLVVDDHDDGREVYAEYLAVLGLRVIEARDGDEALRLAFTRRPALVLLDMGLPVVTGWDVARRLRADPRTQDILIVACTAYTTDDYLQRTRDTGCHEILTKPCLPDQVAATVLRLLGR